MCYPLTVTDQASRYILLCEALESTKEAPVFTAFHRLFEERGLPVAIRSDNGGPCGTRDGRSGRSRGRGGGAARVCAGQSPACGGGGGFG